MAFEVSSIPYTTLHWALVALAKCKQRYNTEDMSTVKYKVKQLRNKEDCVKDPECQNKCLFASADKNISDVHGDFESLGKLPQE